MVTTEQVEAIKSTPKHGQGPLIDAAIDSLKANGRSLADACQEIGTLLGSKPASIQAAYYRRHRDPSKPVTPRAPKVPNPENYVPATAAAKRNGKAGDRWAEFERLINAMVEERVAARMEQVRRAIG